MIEKSLDSLVKQGSHKHLKQLQRGLEKESLRVAADGTLAQTPHPKALGSSLTHPSITTDYSESLLEFITGVHTDIGELLTELCDIHYFTYRHIGNEKLWVNSMPCIVESEEKIPIARYGGSNVAQMKEVYRRGLSHRYGSLMQAIAGIHFNFSLPDDFWKDYFQLDGGKKLQNLISARYFDLIRNFHRNSWITVYLFGASPAVCKSFLRGQKHNLVDFDEHSFYAPNATSLRLSGLGYSNEAQADIEIRYDGVEEFVKSLRHAIQTPHPAYEAIGVKSGQIYKQLNANRLQIENEFYSPIRPKRVTASGQSPSVALQNYGVQYIEIRSIDLNPFEPVGIDADCIRFFDMFLLYCLFKVSPDMTRDEFMISKSNQQAMVMNGRDAESVIDVNGPKTARHEMRSILTEMRLVAQLLDQVNHCTDYEAVLEKQFNKVSDSALTPSARIIDQMKDRAVSFYEFSMLSSERIEHKFKSGPLDESISKRYTALAGESHIKRKEIEADDTLSFDDFLADYFDRQNNG